MKKVNPSPTETLFDCLRHLFSQTGQLLMDSDRIMGERGWVPTTNNVTAEYSGLPSASDRWFPRWVFSFYIPHEPEGEHEDLIDSLKLVSVHFTSDHDTQVDDPLLVAGHVQYCEPVKRKQVMRPNQVYAYWLCKSWFYGSSKTSGGAWRIWVPGKFFKDIIQTVATFALPLYDITSSEVLEQKVINRLFEESPTSP